MQNTETYTHAAKVIALCLPPIMMSLIGLALSRKKGDKPVLASKRPAASVRAGRRRGAA